MLKDVLIQKGLSNREAEVAELVTQGLSNRDVASQLFVTEKTVKFHLTNIYKKMSVKSRAQLIVWCLPHMDFVERGLSQETPPPGTASAAPNMGPISVGGTTLDTSSAPLPTLSTGWGGNNSGKKGNEGNEGF